MIVIITNEPKCQQCTATCTGHDTCTFPDQSGSTMYRQLIYPQPEFPKDEIKSVELKTRSKEYWKSPTDRRFKRGK
jgi:hypothetical protein